MNFGSEGSFMSRPLGVSMLVAGLDYVNDEKKLYHLDPSGSFIKYHAKAIGSGEETAMEQLLDNYNDKMTLKEAVNVTLLTLKTVMEDSITEKNIDITVLEQIYNINGDFNPRIRKIKGPEFQNLLKKISNN